MAQKIQNFEIVAKIGKLSKFSAQKVGKWQK